MRWARSVVCLASASISLAAACDARRAPISVTGDASTTTLSDTSDSHDADHRPQQLDTSTGGVDGTADGASTTNACLGVADQDLIDTSKQVGNCFMDCVFAVAADIARCTGDCIRAETALSPACAECHINFAVCAFDECIIAESDCLQFGINDPSYSWNWMNSSCFRCLVERGCYASFLSCSGGGSCLNSDDRGKQGALKIAAADCGIECIFREDLDQCAATCVANGTELTPGCTSCAARLVVCVDIECGHFCKRGIYDLACINCVRSSKCLYPFFICSGVRLPM